MEAREEAMIINFWIDFFGDKTLDKITKLVQGRVDEIYEKIYGEKNKGKIQIVYGREVNGGPTNLKENEWIEKIEICLETKKVVLNFHFSIRAILFRQEAYCTFYNDTDSSSPNDIQFVMERNGSTCRTMYIPIPHSKKYVDSFIDSIVYSITSDIHI